MTTKSPQHLVDRLLADGPYGVFVSTLLLGAALAVKRGKPELKLLDVEIEGVTEGMKARAARAHARCVEAFGRATSDELECAIALYQEHLRQAGYDFTFGQDN